MVVMVLLGSALSAAAGRAADAPLAAPEAGNTIGDYVWKDLNNDGEQNDGATGIGGVTLELWLWNGRPGCKCQVQPAPQ